MTNDTTPQGAATPSDEEIMAWAMEHQTDAIKILRGSGFVRVARAVLARWGAPQAALQKRVPLTDAEAHEILLDMAKHIEDFCDDTHTGEQLSQEAVRFIVGKASARNITAKTEGDAA